MIKKNLYEVIIDDILTLIKKNQYSYDKPICTEKSLSEQYGVSRITAKRALMELERDGVLYRKRGCGSFVRQDFQLKQTDTLKSVIRQPSADGMKKLIAFILPFDITNGGAMDIVRAAGDILSDNGCYLTLHISDRSFKREKVIIEQLQHQDVSAIIYYPTTNVIHVEDLIPFVLEDKPVVLLDLSTDCNFIYNIVSDNFTGQKTLTEYLIAQGHRSIAYLYNGDLDRIPSIRDRFFGHCTALKENDLSIDWSLINNKAPKDSNGLEEIVQGFLRAGATAIVTENDETAYNVLQACKSLNLNVPQDVSVTGFDDSRWATSYGADITTVQQDFRAVGELAARIVIDVLSKQDSYSRSHVLPVRLIERTSTAAPKDAEAQ